MKKLKFYIMKYDIHFEVLPFKNLLFPILNFFNKENA
jgi:hypothetical protein